MSIASGGQISQFQGLNGNNGSNSHGHGGGLDFSPRALSQIGAIIKQLESLLRQVIDQYQGGSEAYRSIDGMGNNADNPEWGSAGSALFPLDGIPLWRVSS